MPSVTHGDVDAGPVDQKLGGHAASSLPSAVDAGDRVRAYFDTNGRLHVVVDSVAAGTTNIGDVDVLSIAAGETHLGEVTPMHPATVTATVTLTVGATYAANDHVGTSGSPISFVNAVRTSGGSGRLKSIVISDPAASAAAALEVWLFNATVTPPADSAAWTISDADALKCVGVVNIPTTGQFLSALNGTLIAHLPGDGLKFSCAATTLFACLVTRGAPTYTGTLQVILEIEQY